MVSPKEKLKAATKLITEKAKAIMLHTPFLWKLVVDRYISSTDNLNIKTWRGDNLREAIDKEMAAIYPNISKAKAKDIERVIVKCYIQYGFSPNETLCYDFVYANRGKEGRFLSNMHKDVVCITTMGGTSKLKELSDKYQLYTRLKKYYKRDCILLDKTQPESLEDFKEFCKRHDRFIVKPLKGSLGKGTYILGASDFDDAAMQYQDIIEDGPCIVEELIVQTDDLAKFNPDSVNTVRLPLIYNDGAFSIFLPVMRTGRKGYCVDNAGSHGVFAAIDPETGALISDGVDEMHQTYAVHPDSGVAFKGFQLPDWQGLVSLAKEIQASIPGHKYVGWDFAHTSKGWVLVEGNWGESMGQRPLMKGYKKPFEKLMGYTQ